MSDEKREMATWGDVVELVRVEPIVDGLLRYAGTVPREQLLCEMVRILAEDRARLIAELTKYKMKDVSHLITPMVLPKQPHSCPVCGGSGNEATVYGSGTSGSQDLQLEAGTLRYCHACDGKGVLWG